jgi:excisionase family DNA binding protein
MSSKKTVAEWISVPEAAEIMGCSETWVLRLVAQGRLEAFRLSQKAWAIRRTAVLKNLEEYLKRSRGSAGRPRSRTG